MDIPLVDKLTQLHHFFVEKLLFLLAEPRQVNCRKLMPVRPAAEQLLFPPGGARLQGFLLGFTDGGHGLSQHVIHRFNQQLLTPPGMIEEDGYTDRHQ